MEPIYSEMKFIHRVERDKIIEYLLTLKETEEIVRLIKLLRIPTSKQMHISVLDREEIDALIRDDRSEAIANYSCMDLVTVRDRYKAISFLSELESTDEIVSLIDMLSCDHKISDDDKRVIDNLIMGVIGDLTDKMDNTVEAVVNIVNSYYINKATEGALAERFRLMKEYSYVITYGLDSKINYLTIT